ncbi:MAG: NAD(P)-binding domain-containing protein [Corynebacterium sp.]|uniref:NAD(P)-binding domain-containing protein n=1 Tax=unclassified Corynebacterium TaxID=2624378 RepID=UPI002647FB08|nr:NAD(P)-binding domain-containing protein [Corynebacterium sp.]MDN5581880.1 NAD(P)/FAD-dependent oxidoreductase [Corynebacterium sp.]MDN5719082.1 NAD(P)/FAD-dependent oxidoreductase [Corynebacterium sp.]
MGADAGPPVESYEVVVLGAGQAGLAAAHALVRKGYTPGGDLLVLDGNDGPGGAWRHRWDSLTLGRAHGIADLPGMPMPRPDEGVPASSLVADYYGNYEEAFDLRVRRPARVIRVEDEEGGEGGESGPLTLTVVLDGRCTRITTRLLINATGTWTHPYIPYVPGIERFAGRQLHTADYHRREDFAGEKVLVVGGGLSAVQFLLELAPGSGSAGSALSTVWATRRPPNFVDYTFDNSKASWGRDVERHVREDTEHGRRPASVVANTGIPALPEYLAGVADGTLVSRGMFTRINEHSVTFGGAGGADGGGSEGTAGLVQPDSWSPFPDGHEEAVDVIFWNTGFRPALTHLAPLHLREPGGGITVTNEVEVVRDDRVLLAGYGSTASTVGANRAGRLAGQVAARRLAG